MSQQTFYCPASRALCTSASLRALSDLLVMHVIKPLHKHNSHQYIQTSQLHTLRPCHSAGCALNSSTAPCADAWHSHSTTSTRSTPASSCGWAASSCGACFSSCSRPSRAEKGGEAGGPFGLAAVPVAGVLLAPLVAAASSASRAEGKHRASRISGLYLLWCFNRYGFALGGWAGGRAGGGALASSAQPRVSQQKKRGVCCRGSA